MKLTSLNLINPLGSHFIFHAISFEMSLTLIRLSRLILRNNF